MTISSSINKSGPYNGNGVTTVFARTFRILDPDHLKVFQTVDGVTTELTSGLSKDGVGSDTGNVTFDTAPASGVQITLVRETTLLQETDYSSQGKVDPEQVEDDLDRQAMALQDMSEKLNRSVKVPVTYTGDGLTIPEPSVGRTIIGNTDGSGWEPGPTSTEISNAQLYAEAASGHEINAEVFAARAEAVSSSFTYAIERNEIANTNPDNVSNVYVKSEGYEGLFVWVSGDFSTQVTNDPNGGIYVASTLSGKNSTVGAWVRRDIQSEWQATWWGVTNDAVDTTAALQAAVAFCCWASTTGGFVRAALKLPRGVIRLSSPIVVNADRIEIVGSGIGQTRVLRATDYGDTFRFAAANNESIDDCRIAEMTIEHSIITVGMSSGAHVNIVGGIRFRCEDINMIYPYRGVLVQGGSHTSVINCNVLGSYISGSSTATTLAGFHATNAPTGLGATVVTLATQIRFINCEVTGALQASCVYGYLLQNYEEIQLVACHAAQCQYNLFLEQTGDHVALDFFASDCYFDNAGVHSCHITAENGDASKYLGETFFTGCEFKLNGYGRNALFVNGANRTGTFAQGVRTLKFSNCTFSACEESGVLLNGGVGIDFDGCNVKGVSTSGSALHDAFVVGANVDNISITGGNIGQVNTRGNTGLSRYGIRIDNGATNVNISNVNLTGNVTGALLDNSAAPSSTNRKRIVDNIGYNEGRNAQSPAMPASGVSIINPYAAPCYVSVYAGTVSNISINGQTLTTVTNQRFMVGAGDSVSITYSVAPSWVWWPH